MFNRRNYENSRPDGIGLLEITSEMEEASEGPRLFVPLERTELRGEIAGPLAALCLVQTFGYSREQCEQLLEAVYRFPLPGDAAVTHVRVRFGQVEIVTELKEREQAEAEYEEAIQQGKQAALLTRESPDVFALHVAGLQPDQGVVVETSYVQLARPRGDTASWVLRVPLTTAPRYVREDEEGSRYAQGQPLALMRDPGHRFSLDLIVVDAGEISSPTHRIDVLPEGDGDDRRVRLYEESVIPDRDFVLVWTPRQERDRPSWSVMLHDDRASDQVYFMAVVAPPVAHLPGSGAAREVILLVDHSGSMSGAKWEASDWAVNSFLSNLIERDLFALGLFHSTTKWFAREPRLATAEHLQKAARYLDENRESGGTNLGVALEQALRLRRIDGKERGRHVLIITDAQVTDAARILRLADQEAKRKTRRRISVLCIDAAPNAFLANELAERGGGLARFLTSNPDEEDITTALEDVLADWAEPVLVGLRLEVDRGDCEAVGREILEEGRRKTVIDLGDLPCGRAMWVAGRIPRAGRDGVINFRLTTRREKIAACQVSVVGKAVDRPALKALFGARHVLGLEYLIDAGLQGDALNDQLVRLGYDPREVAVDGEPATYAENVRESARKALKALLVRESLSYGLACTETAFVAVRSEAGQRIEGSVAVANALPAGWSDAFLSAPGVGAAMLKSAMPAPPTRVRGICAQPTAVRGTGAMLSFRSRVRAEEPEGAPADGIRLWEKGGPTVVFSGVPTFTNGQALLFDSTQGGFPDQATILRIEVRFAGGAPKPDEIDRELALLVYVDDMALPRARIRLADLVRLGGGRPLNLRKKRGQVVRVVLVDPNGAWATVAPEITVSLGT